MFNWCSSPFISFSISFLKMSLRNDISFSFFDINSFLVRWFIIIFIISSCSCLSCLSSIISLILILISLSCCLCFYSPRFYLFFFYSGSASFAMSITRTSLIMNWLIKRVSFFYKQKLILYCFYPSLLGQFMKNQDY